MAVEGVGGHDRSAQLGGGVFGEEVLGDGEFAVGFFAAVGALGHGLAGLLMTEGDEAAEFAFGSEVLAIEAEGLGQAVTMCGKPGVEGAREGKGIDGVDEVVEGVVAGHFEASALFVTAGEANGAALVLVERGAFAPNGFDVRSAAQQAVGDESEHGSKGVASGFFVAGIGDVFEGLV